MRHNTESPISNETSCRSREPRQKVPSARSLPCCSVCTHCLLAAHHTSHRSRKFNKKSLESRKFPESAKLPNGSWGLALRSDRSRSRTANAQRTALPISGPKTVVACQPGTQFFLKETDTTHTKSGQQKTQRFFIWLKSADGVVC